MKNTKSEMDSEVQKTKEAFFLKTIQSIKQKQQTKERECNDLVEKTQGHIKELKVQLCRKESEISELRQKQKREEDYREKLNEMIEKLKVQLLMKDTQFAELIQKQEREEIGKQNERMEELNKQVYQKRFSNF